MKKALVVGIVLGFAVAAWAVDAPNCMVNVTSTASSTALTADGGTCTWPAGSTVLQQCTVDVYVSSTSDGGSPGLPPLPATSAMQRIDYTGGNRDPYPFYLNQNDKHISTVRAGSTDGTCIYMPSPRRKPY